MIGSGKNRAKMMILSVFLVFVVPHTIAQDIRPVFALFHAFEMEGSEPFWTPRAKVTVDALTHNPSNRTASKVRYSA